MSTQAPPKPTSKWAKAKPYVFWGGSVLIVLFVGLFLRFNDPMQTPSMPKCPIYAVTGTHCPGCGSTRAIHALVHGELFRAFDFNPLMILFLPFLVYGMVSKGVKLFRGKGLPEPFLPPWAIWTLFGIIVAYWILRNLPYEPFTFLAP